MFTFPALKEITGMRFPKGSMINISIPLPKHNSSELMRKNICNIYIS